ncbi:MAG: hypothetical protein JWM44_3491 [Bacilli bacterium]|jgi:uncharacterized protein (DUF697 family)|nr:hypothetical protein [Bacilli bacterium]
MIADSIDELEKIKKECRKMVTKRAAASGGAALVPFPGTDIFADVSLLLQLLPAINKKFGLSEEQLAGLDSEKKSYIYGIITSVGSKMIGRIITKEIVLQVLKKVGIRLATRQAIKFVPFIGQGLAATLSFTAMKYVGNSHVHDCYEVAKGILLANSGLRGTKTEPTV